MDLHLQQLEISQFVLVDKVKKDLNFGVKMKDTNTQENITFKKVWTDDNNWQFDILGGFNEDDEILRFEMSSFGTSKKKMKLMVAEIKLDQELHLIFSKMGQQFAVEEQVEASEAREFLDGYFESRFNRTLTEELFTQYAKDKNMHNWLIL